MICLFKKKQNIGVTWPFLVPATSKMNIPFVEICPASQNVYVILTFYQFYLENYFFPCNLFKDVILSFRDTNEIFLYKYWPKKYCVKKYIFYKFILKMRQPSTRKIVNSIDLLCIFASFVYLIHCLFIHSTHIYWYLPWAKCHVGIRCANMKINSWKVTNSLMKGKHI